MAIAIALPGFSGLGRSVTPTFLSIIRFYLQLPARCAKNEEKINVGNSRFLSTGCQILPSCACNARETVVAKGELAL